MKPFKDNNFGITLFISIGLLSFIFSFVIWEYHRAGVFLKNENWRLELQSRECTGELEGCEKYNPFQEARSKIGKRPYSEDYDCLDHAKDLAKELEEKDIESFIAINQDRSHAVVGVLIDYNGHFVSPNDNFEILEIRDKEMSVICK